MNKNFKFTNDDLESAKVLYNQNNELIVSYEKSKLKIDDIIIFIKKNGIEIIDISTDDGDLEDVFIALTKN